MQLPHWSHFYSLLFPKRVSNPLSFLLLLLVSQPKKLAAFGWVFWEVGSLSNHLIMLIRTTLTLILLVRQCFEQCLNLEGAHVLLLIFDSSEGHVSRHMYSIVLKRFMYVVDSKCKGERG
jgi:hypothetical protein